MWFAAFFVAGIMSGAIAGYHIGVRVAIAGFVNAVDTLGADEQDALLALLEKARGRIRARHFGDARR